VSEAMRQLIEAGLKRRSHHAATAYRIDRATDLAVIVAAAAHRRVNPAAARFYIPAALRGSGRLERGLAGRRRRLRPDGHGLSCLCRHFRGRRAYSVNNITAKKDADGSVAIRTVGECDNPCPIPARRWFPFPRRAEAGHGFTTDVADPLQGAASVHASAVGAPLHGAWLVEPGACATSWRGGNSIF